MDIKDIIKAIPIKPYHEEEGGVVVWVVGDAVKDSFPECLALDHINSWSKERDIVLDIFNGSGTTNKMSKENNRKFIGIEKEKKYCEIAERRLAQEYLF